MLNIISRAIVSTHNRGPRKVAANLMKGLDQLKQPYVVNRALDATDHLWIHDDKDALTAAADLPPEVNVIAGPNTYTVPRDLPTSANFSRALWLYPSGWVAEFWNQGGFTHQKTAVWPVGIDTEAFAPSEEKKDTVIVCVKDRSEADVSVVTDALEQLSERFTVIRYRSYKEKDYQKHLARAKAIIWVGRSESQGIGLLEALASGVPMLVWDITHFGQWEGAGHEHFNSAELAFTGATAAPYFDERCGMKVKNEVEFTTNLPLFLASLDTFNPRAYVSENVSLKKQAQAFLDLFADYFDAPLISGTVTTPRTSRVWKNATWRYKAQTRIKDFVRPLFHPHL